MNRFKKWLINKYLPAYAREAAKENEEFLKKKIIEQAAEIERLKSFISGLNAGLKAMRKIQINNNNRGD